MPYLSLENHQGYKILQPVNARERQANMYLTLIKLLSSFVFCVHEIIIYVVIYINIYIYILCKILIVYGSKLNTMSQVNLVFVSIETFENAEFDTISN